MQIRCYSIDYSRAEAYIKRSTTTKNTGNLLFRVEADREEYHLGTPIYLVFSLENADTVPFFVNKRFAVDAFNSPASVREVYLEVVSPAKRGLLFRYLIEKGYVVRENFVCLCPGEKIYSSKFLLNDDYEIDEVGKYKIVGVYENYWGPEFGFRNAWMGKVESEPVEFEVLPIE